MDKETDDRLIDLEIKFSYQADLLENLNQALVEQQKEIHRLNAKISQLTDLKSGSQDSGIRSLSEEVPPPHY